MFDPTASSDPTEQKTSIASLEEVRPQPLEGEQASRLREQLLEALHIPAKLPKNPSSGKRDDWRRKDAQRGEKSIRESKKNLSKEKVVWNALNIDGAKLFMEMTQHSSENLRPIGQEGHRYLYSSWTREHQGDTVSVLVKPSDDETHLVATLHMRDIVSASNKLSTYDEESIVKLLQELFQMDDLRVQIEHHRMGEMRMYGAPAAIRTVTVSAPLGNRERSFALYQTFEIAKGLARGLQEETTQRALRVTTVATGRKAENPFAYDESTFLYEKVHRITVDSVAKHLRAHPTLVRAVSEVNAIVLHDRVIPTITIEKKGSFFGRPVMDKETVQLEPIFLDRPIEELRIKTLNIGEREAKKVVELPDGYEIDISAPFYSSGDEVQWEMSEELKKQFPDLFTKKEPRETASYHDSQKVLGSLKLLEVSLSDFDDKSSDEQKDFLKQAYRKLSFKWHPDRNENSVESQEKMKEITTAYRVLIKEGGLDMVDDL